MLISLIVPVYNVERYLRECLDSLLLQTYKDIEVIMVDDGSTDSSGKICDEYSEKYQNFFVYHKENAGLGMARNTGLEHMNGQYVTFIDSDDYLDPECIEFLYKAIDEKKVDMCKGGFRRITDHKQIDAIRMYKNEVFEGEIAKKELLPRMIGSSPYEHDSIEMCVCGALYNAELIKMYNLRFPSERDFISEDLVFNIDFFQHTDGACTIDSIGYNYRINMKSLTKSYRIDRFEASRFFYLEMRKKFEILEYDEITMLRLERMFFNYLRMCIAQESKRISGHSRKNSICNIQKICKDKVVQNTISNYPRKNLGVAQNIFLTLIKYNISSVIYLLATLGKV